MKHAPLVLAIACAGASGVLIYQGFSGAAVPGCGPESACAALSAGQFGSILGLPVSFLGAAYAVGLAATLLGRRADSGRIVPMSLRWLVLLGAATSLFYLGVMATLGKWCLYCTMFHTANLALAVVVLSSIKASSESTWRPLTRFSVSFLVVLLGLTAGLSWQKNRLAARDAEDADRSAERVIEAATQAANPSRFTGRHGRGPARSAVRLVVFQDYQCKDCRELETLLEELLKKEPLVHVSLRQFPLCSKCNPNTNYPWFHRNACRAASVAEAAGVLGGEEAYWTAHRWLFEQQGKFEDADLQSLVDELGVGLEEMLSTVTDPRVSDLVDEDIREGVRLGLATTPAVFINGVEIKGVASHPEYVLPAVEKILTALADQEEAERIQELSVASGDPQPPTAAERTLALWKEAEPVGNLPDADACQHVVGNPSGAHRVILFQEPTFGDADGMNAMLQDLVKLRDDVRVEVYLYPISRELNPKFADSKRDLFPGSTIATRLLKAAHLLRGDEGFVAAFKLIAASETISDSQITDVATALSELGDPITIEQLKGAMTSEAVAEAIASDLTQANKAEIGFAPYLIIDGRISPSDTVDAETVSRMLE